MTIRDNPYLNERWYQIQSLLQKSSDDGLKYLTLINGGGAVAVLSFIAQESNESNKCMWISFSIFFSGLLLVGVVNLWRYIHLSRMLQGWGNDCQKYRIGKIEYVELTKNDDERANNGDRIFYLAIICFVLPILGFAVGIINILGSCMCL